MLCSTSQSYLIKTTLFPPFFFRTEWWRYESASNQNYIWTIISEERYFWCKVKSRSILLPIFIFLMLLFVAWTSQRCDHTILKLCFVTIHMNWKSQTILVPSVETLGLFSFVESFVQRHGLYHSSFNILIIITECAHAGETYWQKKEIQSISSFVSEISLKSLKSSQSRKNLFWRFITPI